MKQVKTFFLSSMESARFAGVHSCEVLSLVALDNDRHAVHVTCSPAVEAGELGYPLGLESLLLVNRFADDDLWQELRFPVFVYICSPDFESDPTILAWGELYASADDARTHKMSQP